MQIEQEMKVGESFGLAITTMRLNWADDTQKSFEKSLNQTLRAATVAGSHTIKFFRALSRGLFKASKWWNFFPSSKSYSETNYLIWQIMPNIQRISLQITEIILIMDF